MSEHHPHLLKLLARLAKQEGVPFFPEPGYGYVASIATKSGQRRYLRLGLFDVNGAGSKAIASDKAYSSYFLEKMKYPVPVGKEFYSPAWAKAIGEKKRSILAAYTYAKTLGFPVIVKPNSKSEGIGVAKVRTKQEFLKAVKEVCALDRVFLVQRVMSGRDYRVVVYKGDVIAAYERVPLGIVGDGKNTIHALIQKKLKNFNIHGRKVRVTIHDERIKREVLASGYSFRSILPRYTELALLPNANLSTGGEGKNVTKFIHPTWRTIAKQLANDVGLTLVGIDFLIQGEITRPRKESTWCVLEVNPAPQLHHFSMIGKSEKMLVEQLYRKILRDLWEG